MHLFAHVHVQLDVLLSFEETHYSVEESDGDVQFCVEVCDGELKRNVTFTVKVTNGSAQSM